MKKILLLTFGLAAAIALHRAPASNLSAQGAAQTTINPTAYQDLRWRSVGPHRGGRSTAAAGVRTQPGVFYMGATGGGVLKTENYGLTWTPIKDGHKTTRLSGAIGVSSFNPHHILHRTGRPP